MKIAVLFPGQGSQFLGMGQEFMDAYPECREIMSVTDEVCGAPVGSLCKDGPMEELTQAVNLQPAITAVNLMCWQQLKNGLGEDKSISYFAGHSLGEYSALQAAGVLSVKDTVRLVAERGRLMGREGDKNPGGMRAVLGLNIEEIEKIVSACQDNGTVTAANHNTEQQIVISGDIQGLDAVSAMAEEAGGKVIALNVAVANHSPLVSDAVPDFTTLLSDISFSEPKTPVIFNVSGKPESDINIIRDMMAKQIVSRVNWYFTIKYMLEQGVDTFIEVGPKAVLKGMMRKIVPKGIPCQSLQFDTPEGLQKCIDKLG